MKTRHLALVFCVAFVAGLLGERVFDLVNSAYAGKEESDVISCDTLRASQIIVTKTPKAPPEESAMPKAVLCAREDWIWAPIVLLEDSGQASLLIYPRSVQIWNESRTKSAFLTGSLTYGEKDSGPALMFMDEDGHTRVSMSFAGKVPSLILRDRREIDGEPLKGREIALELGEKGGVHISLSDSVGRTRAVLGTAETVSIKTGVKRQHPASSLLLYNEEGEVVWEAP